MVSYSVLSIRTKNTGRLMKGFSRMRWSWQIQILLLSPLCIARHQISYPIKSPLLQELSEVKGSYRTPGGFFQYSYTLPVSTLRPPAIPNCNRREPPSCVNGTQASFCVYDADYPMYEVKAVKDGWKLESYALQSESLNITSYGLVEGLSRRREEFIFYSLYTGVSSGPTPFDATHWSGPEGFLCPSDVSYARVKRARNVNGEWRVIVQDPMSSTTQTTRLEECLYSEVACRALAPCYKSRCIQRYIYHRLISYDPCDPFKGLFVDIYKLPSACSCRVDGGYLKRDKGDAENLEEPYAEESQMTNVVISLKTNAIVKGEEIVNKIVTGEKANIAAKKETEMEFKETGRSESPVREDVSVMSESETAVREDVGELPLESELELAVTGEESLGQKSDSTMKIKQIETAMMQESESAVKEGKIESCSDSKLGVKEEKMDDEQRPESAVRDTKIEEESETESEMKTESGRESSMTVQDAEDSEELESELKTLEEETGETIEDNGTELDKRRTVKRKQESKKAADEIFVESPTPKESEVISDEVETQIESRELDSAIEIEDIEVVTEEAGEIGAVTMEIETVINEAGYIEAVTEEAEAIEAVTEEATSDEIEAVTEEAEDTEVVTDGVEGIKTTTEETDTGTAINRIIPEELDESLVTTETPVTDGDCVS